MPKAVVAAITNLSTTPVVFSKDGVALTTSRAIAEFVGKRHDNVLRDIEGLIAHSSDLRGGWFQETEVTHPTIPGRKDRAFNCTRDGAILLISGYTGRCAVSFKLAYIRRFNQMESELRALPAPVAVREHKRRPPRRKALSLPAPAEPMARPFEPGSDIARDMRSAVLSALVRVQNGQTASFGDALKEVFDDLVGIKDCGESFSKKPLFDWNAIRADKRRA